MRHTTDLTCSWHKEEARLRLAALGALERRVIPCAKMPIMLVEEPADQRVKASDGPSKKVYNASCSVSWDAEISKGRRAEPRCIAILNAQGKMRRR
jgi:hypothetical protein